MNRRNNAHILFVPSHAPVEGTKMSPICLERLLAAWNLWANSGTYTHILVSGGRSQPYETVDEAVVMREWLIRQGVPSNKIIVENASSDSFESVSKSFWALSKAHLHFNSGVTIVSGRWHGLRVKYAFRVFSVVADRQIVQKGDEAVAGEIAKVLWTKLDPRGKAWYFVRDTLRFVRNLSSLRFGH